jgi:riboflavin-specific deaminase-like protein
VEVNQLLPKPAIVDVLELLATVDPGTAAPSDRPYTLANFIASADGYATVDGRSGPLSDDGDRAIFHGLREQVDAVMAGTGTIRAENYGRILRKRERRERRLQRGLVEEPLACVVTRSGDVPIAAPLFSAPEARVVIFTANQVDVTRCAAEIDVVLLDPEQMTLTAVMRQLRTDYGVRLLLCEGGPTLFGGLLRERLVDDLFLTIAPKLVGGGSGPTINGGPASRKPQQLELAWLLERHGYLYHRYRLP